MRRHLLFLACLAAILAAPAAEARSERRIDLDAAALLAGASASKPVVAGVRSSARGAPQGKPHAGDLPDLDRGRSRRARQPLPALSRHVRLARRHGGGAEGRP